MRVWALVTCRYSVLRSSACLPVLPGGEGALVHVGGRHIEAGSGAVHQPLLEPCDALTELVLTDTPGASGAEGPVPEEEQRAQGDLRDRRRKERQERPASLPPAPQPVSPLPSAGWSTTCLQGPVCLTSSSIRAAFIHMTAGETEEPPSPEDEPAAAAHLPQKGGGGKKTLHPPHE